MPARLLIVMLLLLSACVPPEDDGDRFVRFDADTLMGEIQARGELVVGIDPTIRLFSWLGRSDTPTGLTVELSRAVAAELGVELRFEMAPTDELLRQMDVALGEDPPWDLAFPAAPITESLVRTYTTANPYYVGHQRLLAYSPVELGDLSGGRVCSFGSDETRLDLRELDPAITTVEGTDVRACVDMIPQDAVAVTGPDVGMTRFLRPGGSVISGPRFTTEAYGAIVARGAATFANFVSGVLGEAKEEGTWEQWANRWLLPLYSDEQGVVPDEVPGPPDLTVTEAAALWPTVLPD